MGRRVLSGVPGAARVGLLVVLGAVSCSDRNAPDPVANAELAWEALERDPTSANWSAFRAANLQAARVHGEMHDRLGVQFQVRAFEAQAAEAGRVADGVRAVELAYEVVDAVDDLERKDLFRVYDEVLPGAEGRLRDARERAVAVIRERTEKRGDTLPR